MGMVLCGVTRINNVAIFITTFNRVKQECPGMNLMILSGSITGNSTVMLTVSCKAGKRLKMLCRKYLSD